MNILIDFIPFQHNGGVGGTASFAKAVYDELLTHKPEDINVFGACDKRLAPGRQYDHELYAKEHDIKLLDISRQPLGDLTTSNSIDVFFIAVGQFYSNYDLNGITCKTIMFIHDIFDIERCDNKIDLCLHDSYKESIVTWAKRIVNVVSGRYRRIARRRYDAIVPLYSSQNTVSYTVSDYSANALRYYFPEIKKEVRVCYAPSHIVTDEKTISNDRLRKAIEEGKKYVFMVAANRIYKNAENVMKAFRQLWKEGCDVTLITLKYGKSIHKKHIDIDFLSDSDMTKAYKHAQALVFPSLFEGFGYPPIEALAQGTPTIASNVTSIPEILGEAGIYFSPFYPADIFRAIKGVLTGKFVDKDKMALRLEEIRSRQKADLNDLINDILNKEIHY